MVHVVLHLVSLLIQLVCSSVFNKNKLILLLLAEFFEMDDLYVLCTKPPACVLFQQDNAKGFTFEGLDAKVIPVFPLEGSITIKGYSVRRKQVPMCPAFSLTDYKIQGSTLTIAVLNLKNDLATRGKNRYKKFCSLYIQLS